MRLGGLPRALLREATGQQHVLHHRQVRDQVELLKNESDMVDTKAVASLERRELGAEHSDAALLCGHHSGEQRKKRALAAAARTEKEYALARLEP